MFNTRSLADNNRSNYGRSRRRIWTPQYGIAPFRWYDASERANVATVVTAITPTVSVSRTAGQTSITATATVAQTGSNGQALMVGMSVTFGSDPYEYSVASISGATFTITPALVASVAAGAAINRLNVSQWNDISGNGSHATQSVSGTRPFYGMKGFNDLGCIFQAGEDTDRVLQIDIPLSDLSIFIATKDVSSSTYMGNSSSPSAPGGSIQIRNVAGTIGLLKQNVTSIITSTATLPMGTPGIVHVVTRDGVGDNRIGVNGEWNSNTDVPGYTLGINRFFMRSSPQDFYDGQMGEVLVYNRILPDTETEKIIGYLSHKWGTEERLIASSPYKLQPPVR